MLCVCARVTGQGPGVALLQARPPSSFSPGLQQVGHIRSPCCPTALQGPVLTPSSPSWGRGGSA